MSDDLTPYEPEQLDELLSAELDNELDAAATDLGVTVEEISARLRATPGAERRRAALVAARDLLAQPFDVDELVMARLRAKAVRAADDTNEAQREARKRRRQRMFLSATGVAAAIAVVFALAAGVSGNRGGAKSSGAPVSGDAAPERSAGPGGKNATASGPGHTALGSYSDVHRLALSAVSQQDAVSEQEAKLRDPANASGSGTSFATTTAPENGFSSGGITLAPTKPASTTVRDAAGSDATAQAAARKCVAPAHIPVGPTPALRATAILAGKPVVVLVYTDNGERTVVIEDVNCTLVNWQTFR
jgi:hypothetical protein